MVTKAVGKYNFRRLLDKYFHFQACLRDGIALYELGNSLHIQLGVQLHNNAIKRRGGSSGDFSLSVDIQAMQRQPVSIKVFALHWKEWVFLNPVNPWEHEEVAGASSLIGLQEDCLSGKVQFLDASADGVQLQEVIFVELYLHAKYLIIEVPIDRPDRPSQYNNLASTMEEEIAQIQQLYDRIPQQLMAEFRTSLEEYSLPAQQLQLQSSFDEDALNTLLADLLEREDLPRFQFLVEGRLLRGELKSHILRHELTGEQTLHIEYIISFPNLNSHNRHKEDDWVSAIAVLPGPDSNVALAAALYNGEISFYDLALKQLGKLKVDADPLKSVAVLPSSKEGNYFCISGGMGELLKVHLVQLGGTFRASPLSSNTHNGGIGCIAISPGPDNHFASAGPQGELSIWQIPEGFEELGSHNVVKNKKKKKEANLNVLPLLASSQIYEGTVESLSWINNEQVISGSSQHRMTITNITKMETTETFLTRDSIVTSVDSTDSLILSSHEDGQIRLWDKRTSSKPTSTFKAHSKWVSNVRFNPHRPHYFCSGSHDRTLKIWDSRCGFPLQNIQAEQEKVLTVEWAGERLVACGGSDAAVHLHGAN